MEAPSALDAGGKGRPTGTVTSAVSAAAPFEPRPNPTRPPTFATPALARSPPPPKPPASFPPFPFLVLRRLQEAPHTPAYTRAHLPPHAIAAAGRAPRIAGVGLCCPKAGPPMGQLEAGRTWMVPGMWRWSWPGFPYCTHSIVEAFLLQTFTAS